MNTYFSVDAEFSGPIPGEHAMLSLGACVVGKPDAWFYYEMRPCSYAFRHRAMRIASLGLHCIDAVRHLPVYNPKHRLFRPELVLRRLDHAGVEPGYALRAFSSWVHEHAQGSAPVAVIKSAHSDVPFLQQYSSIFLEGEDPFASEGYVDLEQMYREAVQRPQAVLEELGIPDTRFPAHNALQDALYQGEQGERVLGLLHSVMNEHHSELEELEAAFGKV